jgi:hypothetical protein
MLMVGVPVITMVCGRLDDIRHMTLSCKNYLVKAGDLQAGQ